MLAVWLTISPFIFRYGAEDRFLWFNDYICALLIVLFALLSHMVRFEKMHLLTLAVAGWLIAVAYAQGNPPPPAPYQNYMVIGLLLIIFSILPSHANEPPRKWKEYYGGEWGNL